MVHTPDLLSNLSIYQYHEGELPSKKTICKAHWISEDANNTKVEKLDILKDTICHHNFNLQSYAVKWGHELVTLVDKPSYKPRPRPRSRKNVIILIEIHKAESTYC
jgi:hypothetical protein